MLRPGSKTAPEAFISDMRGTISCLCSIVSCTVHPDMLHRPKRLVLGHEVHNMCRNVVCNPFSSMQYLILMCSHTWDRLTPCCAAAAGHYTFEYHNTSSTSTKNSVIVSKALIGRIQEY